MLFRKGDRSLQSGVLLRKAAAKTSRSFVGGKKAALLSTALLAIGFVLHYTFLRSSGSKTAFGDAVSEIFLSLIYGAIPLAIVVSAVFLWNLWLAPYEDVEDELQKHRKSVSNLESQVAHALQTFHDSIDKIDGFSERFAELQEGFDNQIAAANETISAQASELGKEHAERWKEHYLQMQEGTIRSVAAQEWKRQLDAGHYVNRVDSVECQIDSTEKSLQQLAQRVEYLSDQVDVFAHQMKVRDEG